MDPKPSSQTHAPEGSPSSVVGLGKIRPSRTGTVHLTPYSQPPHSYPPYNEDAERHWRSQDPRTSSTQSLVPLESERGGRRKLLLIYIHGFMGNETSFRSFPAHIHNLLTITLSETHIVHTKIYPRYKSRRPIEYARDDFSNWLAFARVPWTRPHCIHWCNLHQAASTWVSGNRCHSSWTQHGRDTSSWSCTSSSALQWI